jgi:hypothetical protein
VSSIEDLGRQLDAGIGGGGVVMVSVFGPGLTGPLGEYPYRADEA